MNDAAGPARPEDEANPVPDADDRASGDPVCWMHLLCPDCGALPTAAVPDRCRQCGAPRN